MKGVIIMKKLAVFVLVILFLLSLAGCGGGGSSAPAPVMPAEKVGMFYTNGPNGGYWELTPSIMVYRTVPGEYYEVQTRCDLTVQSNCSFFLDMRIDGILQLSANMAIDGSFGPYVVNFSDHTKTEMKGKLRFEGGIYYLDFQIHVQKPDTTWYPWSQLYTLGMVKA
jgi:hypothetical protein